MSYVKTGIAPTAPHVYVKPKMNTEISTEFFPYGTIEKTAKSPYTAFIKHFNEAISAYPEKLKDLYEAALVSERMLRYIRAGDHIKKEPILALLIVMGKELTDI